MTRARRKRKIPIITIVIVLLALAILIILAYIIPGRYSLYQTTLYDPLEETPANPLMGFAPRAEETENTENTKLVLLDISWKEWEPEKGTYDRKALEEKYHIKEYKAKNVHGILRFDLGGKRGWKPKKAIAALGKYFAGDGFVCFVELDQDNLPYAEKYRKAFPDARLVLPSESYQAAMEGQCGLYFKGLGDAGSFDKALAPLAGTDFCLAGPCGGSLTRKTDREKILNIGLAEVLREIRDGRLTYISGNCPTAEEQKGNGYRMISQTLGYCIYINRLQTTVNFRKDTVALHFTFTNTGVAPPYADWPVMMTVYDHRGRLIHESKLPVKLMDLTGGTEKEILGEFPYNRNLKKGYSIGIRICNPADEDDYITLAQKETRAEERGEHIIYRFEPENRGRKVNIAQPDSYLNAMVLLLGDLSDYAKSKNPDFAMFTNGGYKLYMPRYNKTEENLSRLVSSMDGMVIESIFFGYEEDDNRKTPEKISKEMQRAVKDAQSYGLPVFNIEYCSDKKKRKTSTRKSRKLGTVWYNAVDVELSRIPKLEKSRQNDDDCTDVDQVKNYLTVLNPDYYKTKSAYLNALRDTDYDLVFIDLEFHGKPLTKKDIDYIKEKKDGGERLVCSYMSVGEAENYRDYWEESWNDNPPPWICEANANWEGNYKVMYWTKPWRDILFGQSDSYLDKVLAAGFDGVYLDVVDAYEYFEEQENY